MNGAAPLLRIVDTATRSSWSRIPHLKAHIHSRQLHPRPPSLQRPCRSASLQGSVARGTRLSSTSAIDGSLFGQFDGAQEEEWPIRRRAEAADEHVAVRTQDEGLEHSDSTEKTVPKMSTSDFVEEGQPDRVLSALISSTDGSTFIHTASDEAFARAVLCLDPNHFIEHYKSMYRDIPPTLHVGAKFRVVRSFEDRCLVFRSCLEWIIQERRKAFPSITLPVYRHLLQCAEAMGDDQLAKAIFDTDMTTDNVLPDLDCYNSLLTACARSFEYDSAHRKHNRLTEYHQYRRHNPSSRSTSETVLHKSRPVRAQPDEIRDYALNTFKALSESGFQADEKTFTGLMYALGQIGDVDGVNSILRSVWNINVDMLMNYDEEEIESPTFYEEDHPLRPTQRLLEAVVHIYGNNNQIYVASLLSDYISRNYNTPISERVWVQQFDLTYQFTYRTTPWDVRRGTTPGNVAPTSLKRVFDVMTDEPHNVTPTVSMLTKLAQNDVRWLQFDSAIEHLREAKRLLDVERTKLSEIYDAMLALAVAEDKPPFSVDFLSQRRAFVTQSLQTEADLQMFNLAVRRLLKKDKGPGRHISYEMGLEHVTRRIPNVIQEFPTELPNRFTYFTQSGRVTLRNGYMHRTYAIELADDFMALKAALLRRALDVDHHPVTATRLKRLSDHLHPSSFMICYLCGQHGHSGQQCPDKNMALAGHLDVIEVEPSSRAPSPILWQHLADNTKKLVHRPVEAEEQHLAVVKKRWAKAKKFGAYRGRTPYPTKHKMD